MSIRKISATAACFMALAYYSNNVYAMPPESCFQSYLDYEIYWKWGDRTPYNILWNLPHGAPNIIGPAEAASAKKEQEMTDHGPAKRKPITITTKEITVNGKPYMDASESTTPSGEKSYFWQAVDNKAIMDSTSKFPLTPAGAEYPFNLTISDPVCETKATKQLKLHIH